jgi:hypothetical protein
VVGSRTADTLGQRAQAGAKMLYEFLSERLGSNKSKSMRTADSIPPSSAPTGSVKSLHQNQLGRCTA